MGTLGLVASSIVPTVYQGNHGLEYHIDWVYIYNTPYAGIAGMLLHMNGGVLNGKIVIILCKVF